MSRITLVSTALALNLIYPQLSLAAGKTNPAPQPFATAKDQAATDKKKTVASDKKSSPDNTVALEEMVISATKTETLVSNAPAAVSVVTSKDMEARNVSRLGDALSKVPGLYLGFPTMGGTQGGSGSGNISLRGGNTQRTLVLIDGQPMQDGNSSSVDWRTFMMEDIDRVEVVPGAFSSLYGSSAMGGVINVMSKRPDKHELTIRGKKGFMDVAGEDASIYWREQLGHGFGVSGGFSYQDRVGYQNEFNVRTLTTTKPAGAAPIPVTGAVPTTTVQGLPAYIAGEKGASKWTQMNATGKLEWQGDYDRLFAGYAFSNFDMGYNASSTNLVNAAGSPVFTGNVNIDGGYTTVAENQLVNSAPMNQNSQRLFGGYEHNFTDEISLKANIASIRRAYAFTIVQSGDTSKATQVDGPGSLTNAPNAGLDSDVQLTFPLHLKGLPFAKEHLFVSGANFHQETVDRATFGLSNWRDVNSKTSTLTTNTGNTTIYSLYAQDQITVFDPLTVYLGGRFNWWETNGSFSQTAVPPNTPATSITFDKRGTTNFSPKVSAVYRPVDPLTIRASWGNSFRAPTNLDLYSYSVLSSNGKQVITNSDPTLKPETSTSWEIGSEWRITPKITVGATYYETLMKDLIYTKIVTNTAALQLSQKINAGEARIRGVELAFGAKPVDWLELYSNFSYTGSRILSNPADATSVGKRLTSVPVYTAKGGIIANYHAYSGTLEAIYFSHQFNQANNSDITNNVPSSQSEYAVVNAKVGYRINDMIKLNAAVNNLTNTKYYQSNLMPGINVTTDIMLSF